MLLELLKQNSNYKSFIAKSFVGNTLRAKAKSSIEVLFSTS